MKGDLSKSDYLCMNTKEASEKEESEARTGSVRKTSAPPTAIPERKATPHSMRSRRTATWARPHSSDDGSSSDSVLKTASTDFKKLGQRIFVFIIGGATRSEVYKHTNPS